MRFVAFLKNRITTALSIAFSILSVIGWVFCTYPEDDFEFSSNYKILILATSFVFFFLLYKIVLFLVVSFFSIRFKERRLSLFLFEKHSCTVIFIISALVYGLWWFAFFPGTLHPDMTHHLYQGLGIVSLSKNVPVFLTKFIGVIMTISKVYFLNDNVGVIIYITGLYILQCFTVSYVFQLFKKLHTPFFIRWFTLFYVFVIPVFSIWCVNFGKDAPYYNFMVLFICSLIDLIISEKNGLTTYLFFAFSVLGVSLCRNNGIFMILPTMVVYAVFVRKKLKNFMVVCVFCAALIFGFNAFINLRYSPSDTPVSENLSAPIQMYVSYLREYSYELSSEDVATVEMLFSASPADLVDRYDKMISDPVKSSFLQYPTDQQMDDFWTLWKKGFSKHPGCFIRGFLRHAYGYFYPGQNCYLGMTAIYTLDFHTEYYSFEFSRAESSLRNMLVSYAEGMYSFPLTNILYRPGFQMLVLLSLAVCIIRSDRKKNITALVPSLMMVFVVLSPVNAYFRYMLPVFAALPVNIAWTLYTVNIKRECKGTKNIEKDI